jgi:osmotically-inducible protein OsmY
MKNNTMTDIQLEVQTALMQDASTQEYGIEVIDNNGIITLKGVVPSVEASERAEMIARDVDGVRTVFNELAVRSADASNE